MAKKVVDSIMCINCIHSTKPSGLPVLIQCLKRNRILVAEALRKCEFYSNK